MTINIGWGLALIVALYVSIGVSGGHLNPAVTFAMALRGKLSWLKVFVHKCKQKKLQTIGSVRRYRNKE